MLKETGIIMSGDHPLKCLDGTKTMTRRTWGLEKVNKDPNRWLRAKPVDPRLLLYDTPYSLWQFEDKDGNILIAKCPYGGVGDILIMKETWASENRYNNLKPSELPDTAEIFYLASVDYDPFKMGRVHPSLHLPYRFSRGKFGITEIRAERLQEITEEDTIAEGCQSTPGYTVGGNIGLASARQVFKELWDSLNAKRGYGWNGNWWIWPILYMLVEE